MAEQVRHCCKTRHCCRDGSCQIWRGGEYVCKQNEADPRRWSETDDPEELERRKEVLTELVAKSDLPYTLAPAEEHTFSRMMREKNERAAEFDKQQRELDEQGCLCPRALGPDGPSATIREADLLACPVHRPPILKAGCLCGKTIDVCGDCCGLVGNLERQMGLATDAMTDRTGGWCAPSRCAVGVCLMGEEHEEGCKGPGAAYSLYVGGPVLELPSISVRRGGIRFPRFTLMIRIKKQAWKKWAVLAFFAGHEDESVSIGPFTKRKHAEAAETALRSLNITVDRLYREERG